MPSRLIHSSGSVHHCLTMNLSMLPNILLATGTATKYPALT
jgi:hypothetical protein